MELLKQFAQYGLEGLVIAALFYICYRLGNKILDQNASERAASTKTIENIVTQHSEERKIWLGAINDLRQTIMLHNQQMTAAIDQQKIAIGYARDEHKQMIETLGRINGYKHD